MIQTLPEKLEISGEQLFITDEVQNSEIHVAENSTLTMVALLSKGFEDRRKLNFHVNGQNSTVNFIGIVIADGQEKFPFETASNHYVPNTTAFYYLRSAMFDKSEIDYKGNLIIKKEAQQTDCYLSHNTLMLSKKAKTNTMPCLEIEADDVKAGHAAAIGKVDDELLFYLESRGIDKRQGQEMLIKGFLEADLKRIDSEEARTFIVKEIEKHLNARSNAN